MTTAKIHVVNATQLKPGAKYMFVIDKSAMPLEDVAALARHLRGIGIENAVAVMVDGDPKKLVKIIEQESE